MKIKYEVWQLPPSCDYKFGHYDWIESKPDLYDYVMVYAGTENRSPELETEEFLEHLFYILNQHHPIDYKVASLSVSDVVCLIDEGNFRTWWYVDGIGFKKLNWRT